MLVTARHQLKLADRTLAAAAAEASMRPDFAGTAAGRVQLVGALAKLGESAAETTGRSARDLLVHAAGTLAKHDRTDLAVGVAQLAESHRADPSAGHLPAAAAADLVQRTQAMRARLAELRSEV